MFIYICKCAYVYVFIDIYVYVHIYIYLSIYAYIYICIYIQIYYTYVHGIYVYIYIHVCILHTRVYMYATQHDTVRHWCPVFVYVFNFYPLVYGSVNLYIYVNIDSYLKIHICEYV